MLIYSDLSRTNRDLASLSVLSMLTAGPRRADELHQTLVDAGRNFFAENLTETSQELEQAGFIRPAGDALELTDAGQDEARRRVDELVRTPTSSSRITYAAMSFISLLPCGQAISALQHRAEKLTSMIGTLHDKITVAARADQLLIETDYELARLRAEREWVTGVADKLESQVLAWPE